MLARDDVWFIDVGPLWRNHECDYAETFAVGDDPERHRLVRDVRAIFDRTSRHWREARATGAELYRFAAAEAESRGWQLDLEMAGHRLGEYPHAVFHDGLLAHAEFTPSAGLWMLEIQIRHPDRPYSAFFEDLLLDECRRLIQARVRSPGGDRRAPLAPRGTVALARPRTPARARHIAPRSARDNSSRHWPRASAASRSRVDVPPGRNCCAPRDRGPAGPERAT